MHPDYYALSMAVFDRQVTVDSVSNLHTPVLAEAFKAKKDAMRTVQNSDHDRHDITLEFAKQMIATGYRSPI